MAGGQDRANLTEKHFTISLEPTMKALFQSFGKLLAILAVLAFLGFSETTQAYTHHEKSCAVHSHGDSVDHADCKDTGSGHQHAAKDSCSMGHCHTNCGNAFPQQKFVLKLLAPLKIPSLTVASSAYLNPYLGLPLQPPRA
jgi:hypothetical protein